MPQKHRNTIRLRPPKNADFLNVCAAVCFQGVADKRNTTLQRLQSITSTEYHLPVLNHQQLHLTPVSSPTSWRAIY